MNPLAIKALGVLLIVGALYLAVKAHDRHVFKQGEASMKAEWDRDTAARKVAENLAIFQRIKNNERQVEQDTINSAKIAEVNKDEMGKIIAALSVERLRIGPNFCPRSAAAEEAASTGIGNGENTGGRLLSPEVERVTKSLIAETERVASIGRSCQSFIRINGMAPE